MKLPRVVGFGASGTMGTQIVQELLRRRSCHLSVFVLPRERRLPSVLALVRASRNGRLDLFWGDATVAEQVTPAVVGADLVFNTMACISPQADYYPEVARRVNVDAVANVLKAIHAQPDGAQRIRYVHTGTVAATGNRPPGIHRGRVGDPLKPSVFDAYALTKIEGERLVLESGLRPWAILRMSFIMPTTFARQQALDDPIALHMPLDTRMEAISDRDAGFGVANIVDVPPNSAFWGRVYNMGGGPAMRCSAVEFLRANYARLGLRAEHCYDPAWYAERNFHLQEYEDSGELEQHLHFWRDTLDTYHAALAETTPLGLKLLAGLSRRFGFIRRAVELAAYASGLKRAEGHRNSPLNWRLNNNLPRLSAFFFSGGGRFNVERPLPVPARLAHGYDEERQDGDLALLQDAARFRGGTCDVVSWNGDRQEALAWTCAFGHHFVARPHTILHAGHWCPECVATWNQDEQARVNPFFAQVWYADHEPAENNSYPKDCVNDIRKDLKASRGFGQSPRAH